MRYYIIGGDGRQYGPIEASDLRLWIAEGRLNSRSLAKSESDSEFRPLSKFPEFADIFPQEAPQPPTPPVFASGAAPLPAGDYDLPIGGCISGGWQVVKKHFWSCVGVTFLFAVIIGVFNQLTGLVTRPIVIQMVRMHEFSPGGILLVLGMPIVSGPVIMVLMAGLCAYFLKLLRGQTASVSDLFSGFGPSLGNLVLLGFVQTLLVLVGIMLCLIPGIYLNVAWLFAVMLVIDRQMGFWQAMELSRKMVSKHWFVVFGFMIVYVLLAISGLFACLIGIFVTLPIGVAALTCAYECIFSSQPKVAAQ